MQLDRDETLYCFIAAESVKKRYNMFYEKENGVLHALFFIKTMKIAKS